MTYTGDMSLLPPELVDYIISFCDLAALLQLRLVSRSINCLVDASWFQKAMEDIEIHLNSSTKIFMESVPPLPFTKFHVTNQGDFQQAFYRDTPHMRIFKDSVCPAIQRLRVQSLRCCTSDSELDFFMCLHNLMELHIDSLELWPIEDPLHPVKKARLPFNGTHRVMKRLVVDFENNSGDYLIELIQSCPWLQFIQIPKSMGDPIGASVFGCGQSAKHGEYYPFILRLGAQGHLQHLRTLDLNYRLVRMDVCRKGDLRFFQKMLANKKFRLQKVRPGFVLSVRDAVGLETFAKFRQRIASFSGMSEVFKEKDLDNLVELIVGFGDWLCGESEWTVDSRPIRLPALRKITALISSAFTYTEESQHSLECLLHPVEPRTSVTELRINYGCRARVSTHPLRIEPEYLDTSFPNLTSFTFVNHRFSTEEMERLVEIICRKEFLVELTLCFSAGIPESVFFGRNPETPVFLRLKKLKEFRLESTVKTWNVQDESREEFESMGDGLLELLAKMSLTQLYIIGRGWDAVTARGIQSLVEGPFGKSVQRVYLKCLEDTESQRGKLTEELVRLAKLVYGNRVAKGLASSSSDQFKVSK